MKCPVCQYENPENTRFCGNCGRSLFGTSEFPPAATLPLSALSRRLERGQVFAGRYEVIEELGTGGMGTVYKAQDRKIGETVALKILRPEIATDAETIERFRNEIKLARQISHRHVCRMYDLGEDGFTSFITMEYVPGEDLKSFVRRSGHLTEAKALHVARQVCEGLAEAHRLGVVHRDLKPQNIMIDRDGHARIMDFGIARSVRTRGLTGTGIVVGTPEYMSPEQAEAKPSDARSDLYALGVILYEAVTGRVPFEGDTPLSIAIKHKSESPKDPREANPQLSPALSQVIMRLLAKSPSARYQNAGELIDDLDRVAQGLPATPTPRPRRRPTTSREITVKFKLGRALGLGAVGLAVVVAAFIFWPGRSRAPRVEKPNPITFTYRPGAEKVDPDRAKDRRPSGSWDAASGPDAPSQVPSGLAVGIDVDALEFGKALQFLGPILSDPSKYISEQDRQQIEKTIAEIRKKLPAGSPLLKKWDEVQSKIMEGRKLRSEGKVVESRKTNERSESEMRRLMTMVNQKGRADQARFAMETTRKRATAGVDPDTPNLLAWIAGEKEKDAAEAYAKNDFSGAETLYRILDRVYKMSAGAGDEAACLASLRGLAGEYRSSAEASGAARKSTWLYQRAVEADAKAAEYAQTRMYPQAAEFYLLECFLYAKSKDVASEVVPPPPPPDPSRHIDRQLRG